MRRWLETQAYRLTWRGDWISRLWAPIWFRWYCPYPIIADMTARACNNADHCGCDNARRYSTARHEQEPASGGRT